MFLTGWLIFYPAFQNLLVELFQFFDNGLEARSFIDIVYVDITDDAFLVDYKKRPFPFIFL